MSDPQNSFRTGLIHLAYPYARLVALSYGFQHAFGKNHTDENPFLKRVRVCFETIELWFKCLQCLDAAFAVVNSVLNDIARPSQRKSLTFPQHAPFIWSPFRDLPPAWPRGAKRVRDICINFPCEGMSTLIQLLQVGFNENFSSCNQNSHLTLPSRSAWKSARLFRKSSIYLNLPRSRLMTVTVLSSMRGSLRAC